MRVLQIAAGFSLETMGGVERYTFDLSRALVGRGVEVTIAGLWSFGTPYEQPWMDSLRASGVTVAMGGPASVQRPLHAFWQSVRQLRAALSGQTFDIIHSQQEFGDVAALLLKRPLRAKHLVRSVHNDVEWRNRPLRKLILSHVVCPLAFQVETGISRNIASQLDSRPLARLLRRKHPITYNSVDLSRFSARAGDKKAARAYLGYAEGDIVIGSVGRLIGQKGYTWLVQAARQVVQRFPQARFFIAGAGALHAPLQAEIDAAHLSGVFRLLGPQNNMSLIYSAMDVFVSASLWEGLPTVVLEAMLMGVPVVATDVPGNNDLVAHEVTGRLAKVCDAPSLAQAMCDLLSDSPETQASRRTRAKAHAQTFSVSNAAEQVERLYRSLSTMDSRL